jgi:rhodanese-related sulfurtransferase
MPIAPYIKIPGSPNLLPTPITSVHPIQFMQRSHTMTNYDFAQARTHFGAKNAFTTGPHELTGFIDRKADIVIVDVRLPSDFRKAHVPGAINLPKGRWDKPVGLSKDKLNILYCYNATCHLAADAAAQLIEQGYPVMEMEGGFATWEANGYPVEAVKQAA